MEKSLRTTIRTMKADLLTPVLIFKRLPGKHKFLLESSTKYEQSGRYSFIGANPRKTYYGQEQVLHDVLHSNDRRYVYEGTLLKSLKQVLPRISSFTDFPFIGGAVGYIRYDIDNASLETDTLPELQFHIYETLIIFDHIKDEMTIAHTNIDAEGQSIDIDAIIEQLFEQKLELVPSFQVSAISTDVLNLQPYVQRISANYEGDPFELYRKMRVQIPGAYLYYIEFEGQTLIGASKESFLTVANNTIKARAKNDDQQQKTITALKKVAINIEGNEQIQATLQPGNHSLDVLTALLPPTQLDFAEKLPYKKAFGSVVGYIGFNGQIDFTLAENVICVENDKLVISAGEHFETIQNIIQKMTLTGGTV